MLTSMASDPQIEHFRAWLTRVITDDIAFHQRLRESAITGGSLEDVVARAVGPVTDPAERARLETLARDLAVRYYGVREC